MKDIIGAIIFFVALAVVMLLFGVNLHEMLLDILRLFS